MSISASLFFVGKERRALQIQEAEQHGQLQQAELRVTKLLTQITCEDDDSDDDGLTLDEFFENYESERAARRKRYSKSPKVLSQSAKTQAVGAHLAGLPAMVVEHERRKLRWNALGTNSLPEGIPPTSNHFAYRHMWDPLAKHEETEAEAAARKILQVERAA